MRGGDQDQDTLISHISLLILKEHLLWEFGTLFYKKVSLIFTKKLRNCLETFEAQMKIPNKKVRKKLHILTLNALFFIIFGPK